MSGQVRVQVEVKVEVEGRVKPRSNQVRGPASSSPSPSLSINQSINQSSHHHLSHYCPRALSFSHIPIQTRGPRPVRYGSCPFQGLFICRPPSISHVTSKRQAVETKRGTQDIRQTETHIELHLCWLLDACPRLGLYCTRCTTPLTPTYHTQHTHHTRQHRHLVYLLCSVLHAPIVHLVPILLFFCCAVCTRRLGRRNEHLSIYLYSQSRRWIETQLDSTQLNQATDAIPTPLISYDIDDGRTAGTSTSTATQPGPANPHMA